jgi:dienelactone hydrolase
MDPVLAKPTGVCCVTDGSSYQSNSSQSELQQIRGIDTYVSTPNPSNANGNVLLFFADAFGLCTKNYLVMDAFAARGYLVLGVDYFSGVGMVPSMSSEMLADNIVRDDRMLYRNTQ